ncbi:copper resistance CopC family protein [Streptomyces acidicola]|uniref:copper resistance CopC family protein n=1 Tax=Streptomyces acidicola TaxID=2596892 RepID=UPI003436A99D
MYVTDRRAVRKAARVLVLPAALAALATAAPRAAAHTDLDSASPAAESALAELPPRITLTFSDPMTQKYAKVAVTDPDGKSAATDEPEVSGNEVSLALDPASPAGRYTVGYRVVSADGHPVSGSYSFTVEAASESSAPSARETEPEGAAVPRAAEDAAGETAADSTAGESSGEESSAGTVPVLVAVGALAAAVAAAVGAYVARRRRARHGA